MGERDQVFLVELISLICNYAITYGYKPDVDVSVEIT